MDAWLAAHPDDAAFMACVKNHADSVQQQAGVTVDVNAALRSVRARMDSVGTQVPDLTVVKNRVQPERARPVSPAVAQPVRKWRGQTLVFAAAAVAVIAISVQQFRPVAQSNSATRTLATNIGQRDSVTLTDGTRVILAPGSQLTVAASFDNGDRTVELTGAAYFDVVHDASRPFTVHAAGTLIRDIGTAFTVKTDDLGGVSVAVTHGIVAIENGDARTGQPASVELHAGDRGTVTAGTVSVTRGIVTADDAAWTRGALSYRDTPLAEVQADLKRWYGITLRLGDSALSGLTVTMPSQPDSTSMINTLTALLGATAEQHGDTITLHSAGLRTKP